jgi:hypothetical protein
MQEESEVRTGRSNSSAVAPIPGGMGSDFFCRRRHRRRRRRRRRRRLRIRHRHRRRLYRRRGVSGVVYSAAPIPPAANAA